MAFVMVIVLFVTFSCDTDVVFNNNSNEDNQPSMIRSPKEAIELAEEAMNYFGGSSSRSFDPSVVVKCNNTSRSSVSDTILYAVNFGGNNGYAIISASKTTVPLLAVVQQGNIVDFDSIDNPGIDMFLKAASEYSANDLTLNPKLPYLMNIIESDTTILDEIEPRVEVRWGQTWPEGSFCPNGIAGCVPVAAAQALSYFEYPNLIDLLYKGEDSYTLDLDWSNIKNSVISYKIAPNSADINSQEFVYHSQLAHLCREIGYQLKVQYNPTSTSSYSEDLHYYFKYKVPNIKVS